MLQLSMDPPVKPEDDKIGITITVINYHPERSRGTFPGRDRIGSLGFARDDRVGDSVPSSAVNLL